jgi:hypothetical protein
MNAPRLSRKDGTVLFGVVPNSDYIIELLAGKLIERLGALAGSRGSWDRRLVLARLTPEGLKLVDSLDEPVQKIHRNQLGHMGKGQLQALGALVERPVWIGVIFCAVYVGPTGVPPDPTDFYEGRRRSMTRIAGDFREE